MSITQDVIEMKELDVEIKRLRSHLKKLSAQKAACEERILQYLEVHDQPGIKMNGMIIMANERPKRRYKKKSEKLNDGESVLQKYGIRNSREALEELMESMRGSPEPKNCIKIL